MSDKTNNKDLIIKKGEDKSSPFVKQSFNSIYYYIAYY